jgi:hypothetical protein
MSASAFKAIAFATLVLFVASLPRRHFFLKLPTRKPVVSAQAKWPAEAWYKPERAWNIDDLLPWKVARPASEGDEEDVVQPAWTAFACVASIAVYTVLDNGQTVKVAMDAVGECFFSILMVAAGFTYLANYGFQYSLRGLFLAITLAAVYFAYLRLLA